MVARSYTVAFEGVEARIVEVQCAISAGMPGFSVVGLPDKAVSEAKERVRAAMNAMSIALPAIYIQCFVNGIKLINVQDFTATNGTSVILSEACVAGDIVEFVKFK